MPKKEQLKIRLIEDNDVPTGFRVMSLSEPSKPGIPAGPLLVMLWLEFVDLERRHEALLKAMRK